MLRQPTLDLLHELRLAGMAQAFEEQAAMPDTSLPRIHQTTIVIALVASRTLALTLIVAGQRRLVLCHTSNVG